ncbi:MAG: hypothetical protein ACK2UW_08430 [Anaerolineales bacterium]|jgi:hypothetical protein
MARSLTIEEKQSKARDLIQQARQVPVPPDAGKYDMSYIARVKDLLRQARDLVKFIPMQPIATPEIKAEVKSILEEADRADQEIFHSKTGS